MSVNMSAATMRCRGWESPFAHDEVADFSDYRVDVAEKWEVIGAVEFDDGGSSHVRRREPYGIGRRIGVVASVKHQCRCLDVFEELFTWS
jgi:hypothetical protein